MITLSLGPSGNFIAQVDNHTLTIPCNEAGLRVLRRILVARSYDDKPTIGKESSPIQYLVDAWLQDHEVNRAVPMLDLTGIEI